MNRTKRSSPISACRRTPSHITDMRRPRDAVSRFVCMRSFRTHIAEPAVRKGPNDRRCNSSPYMQGSVDRRQVTRERVGHSRTGWRRRLATARTGPQHLVVPVPRIHRGNGDCPADARHRTARGFLPTCYQAVSAACISFTLVAAGALMRRARCAHHAVYIVLLCLIIVQGVSLCGVRSAVRLPEIEGWTTTLNQQ